MEICLAILVITALSFQVEAQEESIPTILAWTGVFETPTLHEWFQKRLSDQKCAKQCNFVPRSDMVNETDYDALLFHSRDIDYSDLPKSRTQDQLYYLFSMEAPGNRYEGNFKKFPPNFFNGTISYSHLNNYIFDYDKPVSNDLEMTADLLRNKTNLVLGIVSNCQSESGREDAIRSLREHVKMTLRGHCYGGRISKNEGIELIKSHRFILALENKRCSEYVSEKGFKFKELIVPIVFSRRIAKDVLPSDSFIAIDDFNSTAELAKHLKRLQNNDTEYLQYFSWLDRKEDREVKKRGTCQLCIDLYNRTTRNHHSFLNQAAFPDDKMCTVYRRKSRNSIAFPTINLSFSTFMFPFVASLIFAVLLFIFARSIFLHDERYRDCDVVEQEI